MPRAQRLLELMELLRSYRHPVAGDDLANKLGISLRTLYRDIRVLQEQGANIEGEAGLGYVLKPGFTLPPLMFTEDEIEALVLGSRWVAKRGDVRLSHSALSARDKIAAVLPSELKVSLHNSGLLFRVYTIRDTCNEKGSNQLSRFKRRSYRSNHLAVWFRFF